MTRFRLNMDLDKWIHQNKGEYIDCIEGCLLDNLLIACKGGTAVVFEKYVNSNSSCYEVYFSRGNEAENLFYERFQDYEEVSA